MDALRIRLLGGFRVGVGARAIPDEFWRLRKSRALTELLGYPRVRNYDGSWTEYGSLVGVPVELG